MGLQTVQHYSEAKNIHLALRVSRVIRCCLWTTRLAPKQVFLNSAYTGYFCSLKQRYILQKRQENKEFLMQQNLFSRGQNEQGIYFMLGKQELVWLNHGQSHLSYLQSETKTRNKSVKGMDISCISTIFSVHFICHAEVRAATYTYP